LEESRPIHPRVDDDRLPFGYKGPVSGYHEHIQQFFLKKRQIEEES